MTDQPAQRILIACIGNIFAGDDAFGVEVARALQSVDLPQDVTVADFGIRGLDLAFALIDPWRAVILVDAIARNGAPGDLYLLRAETRGKARGALDPHAMDPFAVLSLARTLGEISAPVYVVGCQPADLGDDLGGSMGLSPAVAAAIPEAVAMIYRLLRQLATDRQNLGIESPVVTI